LQLEVFLTGIKMRILSTTLQFTLIFGLVACSSSDREKAKEQGQEEGRKASDEARKAGQEIKKEAKELSQQVGAAIPPANGSASEKVAEAEKNAKGAASRAEVHLDKAALLARVKAKLASDTGLTTLKNVEVTVTGTVVTLSGTVGNEYQKKSAVIAASQVEGVSRVEDRITIQN
jgi:osmotically-inducible protein OsmY